MCGGGVVHDAGRRAWNPEVDVLDNREVLAARFDGTAPAGGDER